MRTPKEHSQCQQCPLIGFEAFYQRRESKEVEYESKKIRVDERVGIQAIHYNTTIPISSAFLHETNFPHDPYPQCLRRSQSVPAVRRRRTGTKPDFAGYESAPLHHIPERLQLRDPKRHDHEDDDTREERQAEDVRAKPRGIEPLCSGRGRHLYVGREDADTGGRTFAIFECAIFRWMIGQNLKWSCSRGLLPS